MPKPRYAQVSLDATPYYHCISRCVRRAFLCGRDYYSGQSYEHRRDWIEAKMLSLTRVFALDICAYAIMRNHYHVVLHVNRDKAQSWSQEVIVKRWHQLFSGTALSQRFVDGAQLTDLETHTLNKLIEQWRNRLTDISWFMRVLNESIARQANQEDNCTGRFWEGRFKSQALLDEKALIACMAYVDLNPIRAKQSKTLASSAHTSIRYRIREANIAKTKQSNPQPSKLAQLISSSSSHQHTIPVKLNDYLALLNWTADNILAEKKTHTLPTQQFAALHQLKINHKHWLFLATHFESRFKGLVGCAEKLREVCQRLHYKRTPGIKECQLLFG